MITITQLPQSKSLTASNVTNVTYSKFYSSKLLNYVESTEVFGYLKTTFYSEINTNLNIGDKVFIVNGNYDSNDYIQNNKYNLGTDGYKVLNIDGCKITLDIDYNGNLPSNSLDLNSLLKITHVRSQREWNYVNDILVPLNYPTPGMYSKFSGNLIGASYSLYTNDIVYVDGTFSSPSVTSGFYIKNTSSWINITTPLLNNSLYFINPDFPEPKSLYVIGEDITYNNKTYKQRTVYKYLNGNFVIDAAYKPSYISKLNFRGGNFKSGNFNDGIFGSEEKSLKWNSGSNWNSGVFLSSVWYGGTLNSKSSSAEISYYSVLQTIPGTSQSIPVQTLDFSNNKGFGYNYIIDSTILSGNINNGNFENCNLGITSTYSAIDIYYGLTQSYNLTINQGSYKLCDVQSVYSSNSNIVNSNVNNSIFNNSKLINSQIVQSVANNSQFSADNGINILNADLWSYDSNVGSTIGPSSSTIKGILKLYVSETDIDKLILGDSLYIHKINKDYVLSTIDNQLKVKIPIETRYFLDSYFDKELTNGKITVSIKTKSSNKYKTVVTKSVTSTVNFLVDNPIQLASIDIECNGFGFYYNDTSSNFSSNYDLNTGLSNISSYVYLNSYCLNPITLKNVSILLSGYSLHDADFKSGVFDNSTWVSGDNLNYYQNIIQKNSVFTNQLIMNYFYSGNYLTLNLNYNPIDYINQVYGIDSFVGETIWLNSISYINGTYSLDISGRYEISSVTYATASVPASIIMNITPLGNTSSLIPISIHTGGYYSVQNAEQNNYISINKFLINNSTINSGLFKRTSFNGSNFTNTSFDNTDRNLTLSNINILRVINSIFNNNNNTINSGLFYKSHFVNGTWSNGISFNSYWNKGIFNNGIFKSGYWIDGTFNNGSFIDSGITASQVLDYNYISLPQIWQNGQFNGGEFFNSLWNSGEFNNGRFYKSNWLGGIWNNGILGSKNYKTYDTTMGTLSPFTGATFTIWNNGSVENALVGGYGQVYWYDGKFNDGEFTSYATSSTDQSIWYNGDFNGGKFTNLARWKNGNFYDGKFLSYIGWTLTSPTNSSTYSTDYGWENGKFFGGVFGNAELGTNSCWYNGDFNGGVFQGRLWYNGLFHKGNFNGSGDPNAIVITAPATGSTPTASVVGLTSSYQSNLVEFSFADSFTSSYYGIWYNGYVVDQINNYKTTEVISSLLVRKVEEKPIDLSAQFNNILWLNGTFSHTLAVMNSSLFLGGNFLNGSFNLGVFNPYIDRQFTGSHSLASFNTQSCVWYNGNFSNGSFWYSTWVNGIFNSGYMSGAIWLNGTWNYGTAENVYWQDGRWRNGMWNGTPWDYTILGTASLPYTVKKGRELDLMLNVSNSLGTSSIHLINAFSASLAPTELLTDPSITSYTASTVTGIIDWIDYPEQYYGIVSYGSGIHLSDVYGYLDCSRWVMDKDFYQWNKYTTHDWSKASSWSGTSKKNIMTFGGKLSLPSLLIGSYIGPSILVRGAFTPTTYNYYYGYNDRSNNQIKQGPTSSGSPFYTYGGYPDPTTNTYHDPQYDFPISSKLYAVVGGVGGTTSIFTNSSKTYVVTIKLSFELSTNPIYVEIGLASRVLSYSYSAVHTSSTRTEYLDSYGVPVGPVTAYGTGHGQLYRINNYINENNNPTVVTLPPFSFNVSPEEASSSTMSCFYIRKNSGGIVRILEASIKETNIEYHPIYNNILFNGISGATISLPNDSNLVPTAISDTGDIISINFGNGVFKSGIWENGVWNNGYRASDWFVNNDVYKLSGVSQYYKTDEKTWFVTFTSYDSLSQIKKGDKVSIGNLISIDVNENRKYIKDWMRVLSVIKDTTSNIWSIQVLIYTNFPIRRFEQDSSNHLMYMTKNVWLSGAFLNGYFRGIWNDGLFKGYPNITEMKDSHFINGKFDGGHFISTSNYPDSNIRTNWNTGLVQNFTFIDNNVAKPYKFLYESWMDINWKFTSQTNLYQEKNYYDGLGGPNGLYYTETVLSLPNLNGWVTDDILSSSSYFRNTFDTNGKFYSLGTKYKIYTDFLESSGLFNNLFSNESTYPRLGLNGFLKDGWSLKSIAIDFSTGRKEAGINNTVGGTYSEGTLVSSFPPITYLTESGQVNIWPDDYKVTNIDQTLKLTVPNKMTLGFNSILGATVSLGASGSAYVIGDTFTIDGGINLAIFEVTNISSTGGVLSFIIINKGSGYSTGTMKTTTPLSSIGSGLKVDILSISGTYTWNQIIPGGNSDYHTNLILNNDNTFNIENNRYSMISYNILSFTGFAGPAPFSTRSNLHGGWIPPTLGYGIWPTDQSPTPFTSFPLYTQDSSGNWIIDQSATTKTEFFYNRHSLLLEILANDYESTVGPTGPYPVSINFDNIHFYEVDMIPFFSYFGTTQSGLTYSPIDMNIKTPFVGIAPQIDYSNASFDFLGNVSLKIDSSGVVSRTVSGGGVSIGTFTGVVSGGVIVKYEDTTRRSS